MVKIEARMKGSVSSREYKENDETAPWLIKTVKKDIDYYSMRGYSVAINGKPIKSSGEVSVNEKGFISANQPAIRVKFR